MATYKRGKRWWVDFMYEGDRHRSSCKDNTKEGAKALEAEMRRDVISGKIKKNVVGGVLGANIDTEITLSAFSLIWLDNYLHNNKLSEQRSKRMILRAHLVPFFGATKLRDITYFMVEQYKKIKMDSGLSSKSINNHLTVLRTLLTMANEWEYLEKSVPKIERLDYQQKEIEILTKAECQLLLDSAEGMQKDMLLFFAKTGMRFCEVVGLTWDHIDWKKLKIIIENTIVRDVPQNSTKGGKVRRVPIVPTVLEVLKRRQKLATGPYVFERSDGSYMRYDSCRRFLIKIKTACGLSHANFHVLRHSFCTHMLEAAAPSSSLQKIMGHASYSTTMKTYAHVSEDSLAEVMMLIRVS